MSKKARRKAMAEQLDRMEQLLEQIAARQSQWSFTPSVRVGPNATGTNPFPPTVLTYGSGGSGGNA